MAGWLPARLRPIMRPLQRGGALPRTRLPESHDAVLTPTGQPSPIRTKGDRENRIERFAKHTLFKTHFRTIGIL
jgi:hypothetical protein